MANKRDQKVEKVLEKIKKLLSLAGNNPSEEEAKSASLKAQQLMNDYNLSMSELDDGEKLEMTESKAYTGGDNRWKFELATVISKNFRCEHYWVGKKFVVFYGFKSDCEIAKEVFEFLFKTCKKKTTQVADKAYNETGTSRGVRYSYSKGFVAGIKEVLDKQCTALMIVTPPEVTEGFNGMVAEEMENGNWKTFKVARSDGQYFNPEHYDKGLFDGRSTMQARAIE